MADYLLHGFLKVVHGEFSYIIAGKIVSLLRPEETYRYNKHKGRIEPLKDDTQNLKI